MNAYSKGDKYYRNINPLPSVENSLLSTDVEL